LKQTQLFMPRLIGIAKTAGEAIMRVYAGPFDVERKNDDSPLTQADMAAHRIIAGGLQQMAPEIPVLSEESDTIPHEVRRQWQRYWLVDPLDGTREFIKRNGEFTVNIALIEGDSPKIGVVYAPALGLLYYADENGAYKQRDGGPAVAIHARELTVGDITIAGSRSHADARLQRFIENVERKLSPVRLIPMGSSLKICMVAEGAADLYPRLGPTSEWDTAAAQCILERAGGSLRDAAGKPLSYNRKESLLNPDFLAAGATPHDWWQYL
jgi:3'(2'), 5'-bisphosphate nucleotidase